MKKIISLVFIIIFFVSCSKSIDEDLYIEQKKLIFEAPNWIEEKNENPFLAVGFSKQKSQETSLLQEKAVDDAKTKLQENISQLTRKILETFFNDFLTKPSQDLIWEISISASLPVIQEAKKQNSWVGGIDLFFVLLAAEKDFLRTSIFETLEIRLQNYPKLEQEFLEKKEDLTKIFDEFTQKY